MIQDLGFKVVMVSVSLFDAITVVVIFFSKVDNFWTTPLVEPLPHKLRYL